MENKTYYGEYTLKHWIDLILKQNIVLPDYQRSFVWTKEKIKFFINSIKNNEFIPPVAIGNYRNGENKNLIGKNLILDGQQRLSSILLVYFKCFPIADKLNDNYADEDTENDDYADEDTENDENTSFKDWTFRKITKISKNEKEVKEKIKKFKEDEKEVKEKIKEKMDKLQKDRKEIKKEIEKEIEKEVVKEVKEKNKNFERYEELDLEDLKLSDDFFETHFLGFSYIVPNKSNSDELFTKIFRNINYQGVSLSKQESRRSLYFIKSKFKDFFEGKIADKDVLYDLKLQEHNKQVARIDFVRYLAILSHYHILGNSNRVMKGYSAFEKREDFYIDFISTIINVEQVENKRNFKDMKFEDTFGDWEKRYETLREILENIKPKILGKNNYFVSSIDADYYLFGLLYWVIFENRQVTINENLINEIKERIKKVKNNEYYKDVKDYKKTPNALWKIRERLAESIEIYGKYINE